MNASNDITLLLVIYGIVFSLAIVYVIVSQFSAGREHLVSYRNCFLIGCVIFIGLSTTGLGLTKDFYTIPNLGDTLKFALFSSVFVLTFLFAYSRIKPSSLFVQSVCGRNVQYKPSFTNAILVFAFVCACFNYTLGRVLYIPLFSEVMSTISHVSIGFAAVFAFGSWLRNRGNVLVFSISLIAILACVILSVMSGGGRRSLLGVLLAVPFLLYWTNLQIMTRQMRSRLLTVMLIAATPLFLLMLGYSKVRHFDRGLSAQKGGRTLANSIDALKRMPAAISTLHTESTIKELVADTGQDATACSLLLMEMAQRSRDEYMQGKLKIPQPFFSVSYVLTNAIPRRFWEGKPLALGFMLPIAGLHTRGMNLGPGVVGHCIHEGGLFFIFFYAILFAYFFKSLDAALQSRPDDIMQHAMLAAMAPNVIALVRGDQGVVIVTFIFTILAYFLMKRFAKFFEYPDTAIADY